MRYLLHLLLFMSIGCPLFSQSATAVSEDSIYESPDKLPLFPGGEDSMNAYIATHTHYPMDAREKGIQGTVVLDFIVNKDGKISDVRIQKSVYSALDDEATRVIRSFPPFHPAMKNGLPVRFSYEMPFTFALPKANGTQSGKTGSIHMPEFPGGEDAMIRFLALHLHYPNKAKAAGIQGRVMVGFVINEDGSLSDFVIKKSVQYEIDAEAIRVVKLLPKFIPASQAGKPVKVAYTLPIAFEIPPDDTTDVNVVYRAVDKQPIYPGGDTAMKRFIKTHLNLPESVIVPEMAGKMSVEFVVNRDGTVSNVVIKKTIHPILDAEVKRIFKLLPKFRPAIRNNQTVRFAYVLPIVFTFEEIQYNSRKSRGQ